MLRVLLYLLFLYVYTKNVCDALNNGLALTPPMGWMHWLKFRCEINCNKYPHECVNEKLFRQMADRMVEDGYAEAGYKYIIIDDCWSYKRTRDFQNRLIPDPNRFPHGIKALADYVHSKGLLFGLYTNYGSYTCEGYLGSMGFLEEDAQTFADWGVDYVKMDACYTELDLLEGGFVEFGRQLNKTGRPIVYSCSWPYYFEERRLKPNYTAVAQTCNLWRVWYDIQNSWESVQHIINAYINNDNSWTKHTGPGQWSDADMITVGNVGLSIEQSKAQMALWSIFNSPLIMSNDLRRISKPMKDILLNKLAIGINQDPLGLPGRLIMHTEGTFIWKKKILPKIGIHYSFGIVFLNPDTNNKTLSVSTQSLRLDTLVSYMVEDVFTGFTFIVFSQSFMHLSIPATGVVFYKLIPIKKM